MPDFYTEYHNAIDDIANAINEQQHGYLTQKECLEKITAIANLALIQAPKEH